LMLAFSLRLSTGKRESGGQGFDCGSGSSVVVQKGYIAL